MKNVRFTRHAEDALAERRIARDWVFRCLREPERVDADPIGRKRSRAFKRIPEFGNRWLRVIYEESLEEVMVVTVFFDRRAGSSE